MALLLSCFFSEVVAEETCVDAMQQPILDVPCRNRIIT